MCAALMNVCKHVQLTDFSPVGDNITLLYQTCTQTQQNYLRAASNFFAHAPICYTITNCLDTSRAQQDLRTLSLRLSNSFSCQKKSDTIDTSLSVFAYVSVCLYVCLPICLSVCLLLSSSFLKFEIFLSYFVSLIPAHVSGRTGTKMRVCPRTHVTRRAIRMAIACNAGDGFVSACSWSGQSCSDPCSPSPDQNAGRG
jgi:hypothetical protein